MVTYPVTLLPPPYYPMELLQCSLEKHGYDVKVRKDNNGSPLPVVYDVDIKKGPEGGKIFVHTRIKQDSSFNFKHFLSFCLVFHPRSRQRSKIIG